MRYNASKQRRIELLVGTCATMITEKGIVPANGGQYKLFSNDQLKALHDDTMEVLIGLTYTYIDEVNLSS
jgi:trimethylamine:corrinoid methyltransferase-like protein